MLHGCGIINDKKKKQTCTLTITGVDKFLSSLYSNMCSSLNNTVPSFQGSNVSNCTFFGNDLFKPEC